MTPDVVKHFALLVCCQATAFQQITMNNLVAELMKLLFFIVTAQRYAVQTIRDRIDVLLQLTCTTFASCFVRNQNDSPILVKRLRYVPRLK